MTYLVTYTHKGKQKVYYTHWFDPENHFAMDCKMVVCDLINHRYMIDGKNWIEIEEDHL